jgi:hypothetical protein
LQPTNRGPEARAPVHLRHLRFGWWALLAWLATGIALETLHGFKIGWLLDVGNDTRRLMFRLAHTHGTFLALVNIAAALTVRMVNGGTLARWTSFSLIWSALLIPIGFLLGGIVTYGGDPGFGVWLVPIGAALLLYGVARTARDLSTRCE